MVPPGLAYLTMLDGCRAGPLRPTGLARTTGKIDRPESRGSLGAKWRTVRLVAIEENPGETAPGMFAPAMHAGKVIGAPERRRPAARLVPSGLALPRHLIGAAAGRSRGLVGALMKAEETGPPGTAADATGSVQALRVGARLVPTGIIQPPLHQLEAA
jgi:hypothetical protein